MVIEGGSDYTEPCESREEYGFYFKCDEKTMEKFKQKMTRFDL